MNEIWFAFEGNFAEAKVGRDVYRVRARAVGLVGDMLVGQIVAEPLPNGMHPDGTMSALVRVRVSDDLLVYDFETGMMSIREPATNRGRS